MEINYLYLGIGALVLIAVLFSKNIIATFSSNGISIKKQEGKNNIELTNINNTSEVEINVKKGQNVKIDNVDSSTIKIN